MHMWMSEYMLPWCDYLRLDPTPVCPAKPLVCGLLIVPVQDDIARGLALQRQSPSDFIRKLAAFSAPLLTGDIPQELMLLWQRLAVAGKTCVVDSFPC